MLYMVIGASKSGKSRYAEHLASTLKKTRMLYIATMIPVGTGEAGDACINRHRTQRAGLDFITIEQPAHLEQISLHAEDVVLLEDVHNLVGNYLFVEKRQDALAQALQDIEFVTAGCKDLVAVSYKELPLQESFDLETCAYVEQMNEAVRRLCERADAVILLEQGQPRTIKGSVPE